MNKNKYWHEWYQKNKERFLKLVNEHKKKRRQQFQELIDQYKNKPCIICGQKYDPIAMDLYHVNKNEKKFRISDAKRLIYNIKKLVNELNKCDVYCAICRRIVDTEILAKNNGEKIPQKRKRMVLRALINKHKNQPCADCGKIYPPYAMELDHLDGAEKEGTVSSMVSKEQNIEDIEKEVAKTQVVCLNCHRLRTKNRRLGLLE